MTVRRRLQLSFLVIVALFAVSQAIYFLSAHLRAQAVKTLDRALQRRAQLTSLSQDLGNLHKQVTLLSQMQMEQGAGASSPQARQMFTQKVDDAAGEIKQLKDLTEPANRSEVEGLEQTYTNLAEAWKGFYQYLGVEQGYALVHLVRADPLSQSLLNRQLPDLQNSEAHRIHEAETRSAAVERLTNRITISIFLLSILVAVAVAYSVSRFIISGCGELKLGAALIGAGRLEHRIPLPPVDELGQLAQAINDMADNLAVAREQLTEANEQLEARNREIERHRRVSESLLRNILPAQVAEELQSKGEVQPRHFEDVTILFTDFVGFTLSTQKLAAEDLVHILHDYFTAFDQIVVRYGLEKLKTIGDSYMCVGGLPVRNPSHPVDTVMAAFEMVRAVVDRDRPDSLVHWGVRIGIHTGPVVAGVVGIQKFAFDVWGDSVNYASRMESGGGRNRINLSSSTYRRVKDFFDCEYRGKILTKEKIEFDMYFVKGVLPNLLDEGTQVPPSEFLRRYHSYFQKDPPAFPAFLVASTPTESKVST